MALTTAAAGAQRDAMIQNLKIVRQGTAQTLADVLSIPDTGKSLPARDERIWAEALDQDDLAGAMVVSLGLAAPKTPTPECTL